jgi:anti-sigma B factor antagonist
LEVKTAISGKQVLVELSGSIYIDDSVKLKEILFSYISVGVPCFLIDFSKVEYIDSSGLGVLVGAHNKAKEKSGGIKIKGLHGIVKSVFCLARLETVFEIVDK